MQEPDTNFLAPEYLEILENEEQIKRELKEQPGRLHFLHGIIVDLFVDNAKFKGQNVTSQVRARRADPAAHTFRIFQT
jgi:hypothetical protein